MGQYIRERRALVNIQKLLIEFYRQSKKDEQRWMPRISLSFRQNSNNQNVDDI